MSFHYETQEEFSHQLGPLIEEHGQKVRLVLKYHHIKGELNIRSTDDEVCLKYTTRKLKDIHEGERLLMKAMAQMCDLTQDDIVRQKEKLTSGMHGSRKKKKKIK